MKKILTILLDGFGMREDIYGNAVKMAGLTNFINMWNNYPHCLLKSSGKSIGLLPNQSGFSEFSHKTIAAGRIVSDRFNFLMDCLSKNKIKYNKKYNEMVDYLKSTKKNLHISLLLSDGNVSSSIDIFLGFMKELSKSKINNNIYLHLISDGRDSSRCGIIEYIDYLKNNIGSNVFISDVCGRYYALDNTGGYSRTKYYYELLMNGKAVDALDVSRLIKMCYSKKLTDEYLPPLKNNSYKQIGDGDVLFFCNFSRDNQFQFLNSLCNKDFCEFKVSPNRPLIYSLFEIEKSLNSNYLFNDCSVDNTILEYLGNLGLNQACVYESIRKESMKFYLNGEKNVTIDNLDYYEIPSLNVDSFDVKPEMSSLDITKKTISCMESDYDFIIVNYPNADEIGHTGNYQAVINGLQTIDVCLGKLIEFAENNFYKVIICGTHGNADTIIDKDNNIITKNTMSPVPFAILDKKVKLHNGSLDMVAPTILKYMDIKVPDEMKETEILLDSVSSKK